MMKNMKSLIGLLLVVMAATVCIEAQTAPPAVANNAVADASKAASSRDESSVRYSLPALQDWVGRQL